MSEQSLDSLFGTLSTKVPLTSDAPKTSNASIQTNQGENGFHASLMNSMKDASADDNQTDLFSSSDTNNEQDINQIGDMASLSLSNNNIGGSQVKLQHDIHQSITTEAITNFITNNSTDGNSTPAQSQASILSDNFLLNDKSKTPNEPGSNLSKVFKDATIPVSENVKTKQSNLEGKSSLIKITDLINNNSTLTGQTSTSAQIQKNTLLDNIQLNQESKAPIDPKSNLLNVLKETIIPVSDRPNSNQSSLVDKSPLNKTTDLINNAYTITERTSSSAQTQTNTLPDNILLSNNGSKTFIEQDSNQLNNINATTPSIDKLKANQNNTKNIEQNTLGTNSSKIALQKESSQNPGNTFFETNNNSGQSQNTASSGIYSNTITNNSNDKSRLNIENERPSQVRQASRTLNSHNLDSNSMFEPKANTTRNSITNHNTLLSPEESVNGKTYDYLKEQQTGKIPTASTTTKSPSQQGLAKADSNNNESSLMFNTSPNSTEANFAKSFDNTTFTQNSGVNAGDITSFANTSSDNSSFNNQGSDFLSELNINSVNTRKIAGPETNFTDTLSQIINTSKPLGTLGNNVADNIIQSAKLYIDGGKSEIKLQLNPPELGALKLEFTVDNDILEAKITVDRSAVKDIIEKDIPRLRELISGADIDLGKLDVSLQENENNRFGFKDKNFQPDSENSSTQDSSNQKNEEFENETEEKSITENTDSKQINYLV